MLWASASKPQDHADGQMALLQSRELIGPEPDFSGLELQSRTATRDSPGGSSQEGGTIMRAIIAV